MTNENKNENKNSNLIYKILFVVFTVEFVVIVGIMVRNWIVEQKAKENFDKLQNQTQTESESESETTTESQTETETEPEIDILEQLGITVPEKNLDWNALWETNEDIYAWVYIPNTNIDYPVLQHEVDDTYYLDYNLDGSKGYPGCIYSERKYNSKSFLDFNTLIYGHNMKDGTMFKHLHLFEDDTFFEENRYAYIYMPDGAVYVYDIFAAYVWDDTHIIAEYGLTTDYQREIYLDDLFNIRDMSANFREGVEVDKDSKILTMVTCIGGRPNNRYLVQGVMVNPPTEE